MPDTVMVDPLAADAPMPFSNGDMRAWGFVAWRCLPDGTVIAVGPMSFSNGRLFWDVHQVSYEDFYCYDSVASALAGMPNFRTGVDEEPFGWHRHYLTGRRRPHGDPVREYINF